VSWFDLVQRSQKVFVLTGVDLFLLSHAVENGFSRIVVAVGERVGDGGVVFLVLELFVRFA
jgi:hypothetical protein